MAHYDARNRLQNIVFIQLNAALELNATPNRKTAASIDLFEDNKKELATTW